MSLVSVLNTGTRPPVHLRRNSGGVRMISATASAASVSTTSSSWSARWMESPRLARSRRTMVSDRTEYADPWQLWDRYPLATNVRVEVPMANTFRLPTGVTETT